MEDWNIYFFLIYNLLYYVRRIIINLLLLLFLFSVFFQNWFMHLWFQTVFWGLFWCGWFCGVWFFVNLTWEQETTLCKEVLLTSCKLCLEREASCLHAYKKEYHLITDHKKWFLFVHQQPLMVLCQWHRCLSFVSFAICSFILIPSSHAARDHSEGLDVQTAIWVFSTSSHSPPSHCTLVLAYAFSRRFEKKSSYCFQSSCYVLH